MPDDGGRHTRIVRWLKVALPLAALALLSTLFLVSNRIGGDIDLPYSEGEIEDRVREPRMTRPSYSGVTSDGSSLILNADEARPAGSGQTEATGRQVIGTLQIKEGGLVTLESRDVVIDTQARIATLTGDVLATTSEGLSMATEGLIAALDRSHLESTAPVVAEGPPGRITADRMDLTADGGAGSGYVLRFIGNVKLIYQPSSQNAGP